MKVGKYTVQWEHRTQKDKPKPLEGTFDRPAARPVTFCYIYLGDNLFVKGQAVCSVHDQFEREQGRKISLARALQNLYPAFHRTEEVKNKREVFWNAFRHLKKTPKW